MKTTTHVCCSCVKSKPVNKLLAGKYNVNGIIDYKNNVPEKKFKEIYNKVKKLVKGETYISFIERYGIKIKYKLSWEEDNYVTINDVSIDTKYHTIGNDALLNVIKDLCIESMFVDYIKEEFIHELPEYVEFQNRIKECCKILNKLMDDYPGFDDQLFIFDKIYRELREK